jgi:hypothetical protein
MRIRDVETTDLSCRDRGLENPRYAHENCVWNQVLGLSTRRRILGRFDARGYLVGYDQESGRRAFQRSVFAYLETKVEYIEIVGG